MYSSKKPSPTNWLGIFNTFILMGIFGMMIYISASVPSLQEINRKFVQPEIFSKFPTNQMEMTTRQILSIIENVQLISTRSKVLLSKMEPEHGLALVGDVKTVVERLSNLLERNTTDALMEMVRQINKIPMKRVGESLALLDFKKINELADSTRLIEEKINKIHEVKIQI